MWAELLKCNLQICVYGKPTYPVQFVSYNYHFIWVRYSKSNAVYVFLCINKELQQKKKVLII